MSTTYTLAPSVKVSSPLTIFFKNLDQHENDILRKIGKVTESYVRTCNSSTCSCFSHEPGYHVTAFEARSEKALLWAKEHFSYKHGSPSSHGYHYYDVLVPLQRTLDQQNRPSAEEVQECNEYRVSQGFSELTAAQIVSVERYGLTQFYNEVYAFKNKRREFLAASEKQRKCQKAQEREIQAAQPLTFSPFAAVL